MNLNLQYEGPKDGPISLNAFEVAIKKKHHKKNELDQIAEFNRRSNIDRVEKSSGLDMSEFNFQQWNSSIQQTGKVDFFEEEGKQLLGSAKTVKYLDWKLVIIDLVLHIIAIVLSLFDSAFLILTLRDLPIVVVSVLILYDKLFNASEQSKQNIIKTYSYILMLSAVLSIYAISAIILTSNPDPEIRKLHYGMLATSIGGIFCEYKLWKASKYLLFFLQELDKKESREDIDFNDEM